MGQVDHKKYHWHREYHDKLMSNAAYQRYSFEVRGIYKTIRDLAGQTGNAGSVTIGGQVGLTVDQLVDFLSATPGSSRRRVRSAIEQLLADNFLLSRRNRVVIVADWVEEQQGPPSYEAEKKRKQKARKAMGFSGKGEAEAASPFPVPAQVQYSGQGRGKVPQSKGDFSPILRTETERDTSVSLNTDAEPETFGVVETPPVRFSSGSGPRGPVAGTGKGEAASGQHPSLVMEACRLVKEFDVRSVNVWSGWIRKFESQYGRDVGNDLFAHALNVLRDQVNSGKPFRTSPSAFLQGVLRRMQEGGHP